MKQGPWRYSCRISLPLSDLTNGSEEGALVQAAAKSLRLPRTALQTVEIRKKSLDARDKGRLRFVYQAEVKTSQQARGQTPLAPQPAAEPLLHLAGGPRPWVIGAGPAGLFAALYLARSGLSPIVVEQGQPVEERREAVDLFWSEGKLDPWSNIQSGEGGAGAFSDGKLTSRSKDELGRAVLRELADCGGDPSILYWHKPHLGSDVLPLIIRELRQRIISLGGSFLFNTRLTDIHVSQGRLQGLTLTGPQGQQEEEAHIAVLAVGNGAGDTYCLLSRLGLALAAKPFAVGLRLQHAQSLIDNNQYGSYAGHPLLGAADYQLTYQAQDRGCYTFCNCPGGFVVNAAADRGGLVTNGVSLAARDSGWSNAAVVAQVAPGRDFPSGDLAGLEFQRDLERAAFELGGGDYSLPVMSAAAFCGEDGNGERRLAEARAVGQRRAELRDLFTPEITAALQGALKHWERQIPGFISQGVAAAVESRTSAPVRVLRGQDRQCLNCRGLYPAGEGAGYAGGIVSSAIDGIKAALAIMENSRERS